MITEKWLNQRVSTVYSYWQINTPDSELHKKCVDRVLEMIQQYREGEDPEHYRAYVEQRVQCVIDENTD